MVRPLTRVTGVCTDRSGNDVPAAGALRRAPNPRHIARVIVADQPLATTGPLPIGALPIGALPMGALPIIGVGGGGCRVGKSAAIAAHPKANIEPATQIKCLIIEPPIGC
jgi:hypothetical protein